MYGVYAKYMKMPNNGSSRVDYQKAMGEIEDGLRCKECGKLISPGSKSGYCKKCVHLPKFSGKKCKECGVAIAKNNRSGYCKKCHPSHSKEYNRKRAKRAYGYYYVSYKKRVKKKTNGKMGKCKMPGCGKEFPLESWQHSSLHYCPRCGNSQEYKEYHSYEMRASRYGVYK